MALSTVSYAPVRVSHRQLALSERVCCISFRRVGSPVWYMKRLLYWISVLSWSYRGRLIFVVYPRLTPTWPSLVEALNEGNQLLWVLLMLSFGLHSLVYSKSTCSYLMPATNWTCLKGNAYSAKPEMVFSAILAFDDGISVLVEAYSCFAVTYVSSVPIFNCPFHTG